MGSGPSVCAALNRAKGNICRRKGGASTKAFQSIEAAVTVLYNKRKGVCFKPWDGCSV